MFSLLALFALRVRVLLRGVFFLGTNMSFCRFTEWVKEWSQWNKWRWYKNAFAKEEKLPHPELRVWHTEWNYGTIDTLIHLTVSIWIRVCHCLSLHLCRSMSHPSEYAYQKFVYTLQQTLIDLNSLCFSLHFFSFNSLSMARLGLAQLGTHWE